MIDQPPTMPAAKRDLRWIILAAIVFVAVLAVWLWFTPAGFWGKLRALGYAVCHQLEERSTCIHGICSPLCARCTGMYLGAILSLGYQAFKGRRAKFPPVWVIVVLVLLFGWFGVDGMNSFLHFFPKFSGIYEPTNTLRLITGMGVGLGIGTLLYVLFNRTAWSNWVNKSPFKKWHAFPLLLILAAVLIGIVQIQHPLVQYPLMVISGLGVFIVLSSVYSVVALMILRRENAQLRWRELLLPILMGMTIALLQVLLTSWLRLALTGTWEPITINL